VSASPFSRQGPKEAGFRWPAEWEPHAATLLSWPHNRETWPGRLAAVERAFCEIVAALAPHEEVHINVKNDAMQERVRARLEEHDGSLETSVRFLEIETDDAWVRDHGPIGVVKSEAAGVHDRALVDFSFNAWGGKYPPWQHDDAVPRRVSEREGLPRFEADWILEGGSIDGNGAGCVLTTESCLLNPNRNKKENGDPVSKQEVEAKLEQTLACDHVLWLGDGVSGDDTDGHVDDVARFVATNRIVAARESNEADSNHKPLEENWGRLQGFRNERGQAFELIELPMPPAIVVDGQRCPASYANFYIANNVLLVPIFDVPSDTRALEILADCLPGRDVVGIPSRDLVVGLGTVHCLTQQLPR